jgi:O-methyltransferase involved in polyketide biosynthesis
MLLLTFAIGLLSIGAVSRAIGQVSGQPYRLSDKEVERILQRLDKEANAFRKSLHDALKKSRWDKTRHEDDINGFVKEFSEQTSRLRDNFRNHKSTAPDIEAVLDRAARIDGFMSRYLLTSRAQSDWSALRGDLNYLAQAYNVSWRWGDYSTVGGSPAIVTADAMLPYRLSDKEVEQLIHRIENQSHKFRSSLDSALDKSRFDGSRREDDINASVKEFYAETKRLHDHFDNHKSTGADVQSVLDRAVRIDDFMRRFALTRKAQNDWSNLRANLDELARAYTVTWQWRR